MMDVVVDVTEGSASGIVRLADVRVQQDVAADAVRYSVLDDFLRLRDVPDAVVAPGGAVSAVVVVVPAQSVLVALVVNPGEYQDVHDEETAPDGDGHAQGGRVRREAVLLLRRRRRRARRGRRVVRDYIVQRVESAHQDHVLRVVRVQLAQVDLSRDRPLFACNDRMGSSRRPRNSPDRGLLTRHLDDRPGGNRLLHLLYPRPDLADVVGVYEGVLDLVLGQQVVRPRHVLPARAVEIGHQLQPEGQPVRPEVVLHLRLRV